MLPDRDRDRDGDRGRSSLARGTLVVAAIGLALVVVAATGALAIDTGPPDGETVLNRTADRYANASSISGDATITVANATRSASLNTSFVVADDNRSRLTIHHDGHRYVFATNGTVVWAHNASSGRVLVARLPDNGSLSEKNWSMAPNGSFDSHNGSLAELDGSLADLNGSFDGLNGTLDGLNESWNGTWANASANHTWMANGSWSSMTNGSWSSMTNGSWSSMTNESWWGANGTVNLTEYVESNLSIETVGTERVDGAESYVVRVTHRNESRPGNLTFWIDADNYTLYRARAAVGTNTTTIDFENVLFNVSARNSTFRPPTADATWVSQFSRTTYDSFGAAQANTSLSLRSLDGEYTFTEATVTTRAGVTVTVQQYEAGNRSVTLAATADSLPFAVDNGTTVSVGEYNGTYVEAGDRGGVVYWTVDGVTRAVVADLPRERLVALAERVVT